MTIHHGKNVVGLGKRIQLHGVGIPLWLNNEIKICLMLQCIIAQLGDNRFAEPVLVTNGLKVIISCLHRSDA